MNFGFLPNTKAGTVSAFDINLVVNKKAVGAK
jgi:hypothetical protein